MSDPKILVMIPTFNERANMAPLIENLFHLPIPGLEVIVLDDNSPDGTGHVVEAMRRQHPRLHLVSRSGPRGRGRAGRDGFLYALKVGFDYLVEMDGDGSHQPKHIPSLLAAMNDCDIALGSRMVKGGSDRDRPWLRQQLTRTANAYARRLLCLPVYDTNSGFRCFSRKAMTKIDPRALQSEGPSIVHEVLFRARQEGLRIKEVPIEFIDRKKGESKLSLWRLGAGYFSILKMRKTTKTI